jgi:hypothetical protein
VSTLTIVTLPDGKEIPLDDLRTQTVNSCDGCGRRQPYSAFTELIRATIGITPASDADGEGASISAHLCGHPDCQLSAMARHFEAIWPLPENEVAK